ncbi:MAG: sigma-54-dependent transcriptional regulator [Desulfobacterales bacterium]
MSENKLLIIDDEEDMLEGLKRVLGYELNDVEVDVCSEPSSALRILQEKVHDLVLLDLRMPGEDGLDILQRIKKLDSCITVIMMTAYGSIEVAVQAIKMGAYDFISKPFNMEDLLRLLRKALERNQLLRENRSLRDRISQNSGLGGLVGQSPAMGKLFESIRSIANTDYAVLIRGESGTGKELVARAVHDLSPRGRRGPVTVNCPAIPEHLLESQLFGHKKGAFTGALNDQKGLFEEAHGSSLLLDEIADIPVSVQTKLLRFLQEKEIRPLGAKADVQVDVRILSTTNQNLEQKIVDKSFREDLFYRLNVITINTPSLEEIREDIPLIADHFTRQVCSELVVERKQFSPEAMEVLMQRKWPGNVRELRNFVRRVIVFTSGEVIGISDIKAVEDRPGDAAVSGQIKANAPLEPYSQARERVLQRFSTEYVEHLLEKTGGNISKGARLAGLSRVALQKILRRTGVDPENYRRN